MQQPDLFTPQPRARNSDPQTSQDAARAFRGKPCRNHYLLILGVMHRPMTGREIAKLTGLSMEQVCRRLPELDRAGLARPTDVVRRSRSGHGERVWEAIHA